MYVVLKMIRQGNNITGVQSIKYGNRSGS